jgi:hypothetical protein
MKRLVSMFGALALLWGGAGSAGAGAIQLTLPSQLNPGDTTFVYPQAEFDIVPSPYVASAGGNTLTFKNLGVGFGGGDFLRLDQGSGWGGDFAPGTKLLYNQGAGATDIKFLNGVGEVGLGAQSAIIAAHTFTATAYNGATALLTFTVPGDGFVSFIGVQATGSDVITELKIASDDNDFAFGPTTFGSPATVPEPSTLTLFVLGAVGLCGYRWRRRKQRA